MELRDKIEVLAEAAKYDVSCSSSGSSRKGEKGSLGNASLGGICHSWSDDGRCISLLKILMSNSCIYDCKYCVNRSSNDIRRVTLTCDELVYLTMNFYRRNYIEGLFLSSAIVRSPDYTMEQMLRVVKALRQEQRFNGYIHLKAIPGCDYRLIDEAGRYVDRMSVNIELPTSSSLKLLAPQKSKETLLTPMAYIKDRIMEHKDTYRSRGLIDGSRSIAHSDRYTSRLQGHTSGTGKKALDFVPAGQTTQLVIGASPEKDLHILRLSEALYRKFSLKRVYYSAYMPVNDHPALPVLDKPPLLREHRLYQADWLLRFYGFSAGELLDEGHQELDNVLDPKSDWAVRNYHLFPVEVNKADYEMLLRVPGIGVRSAQRIVSARRVKQLDHEDLKKMGVVLKRARHFIACGGRYYGVRVGDPDRLRLFLMPGNTAAALKIDDGEQLSFLNHVLPSSDLQEMFMLKAGEI
ncbi:MAG TPA: putative DNA modification/repair radical SAM protein [Candidatus Atribacteria bacterium]|nr:putative DNA modification/repair radical SAM protein [Candidatus Atribacteria bacterium]HPT78202.1 putative DNA modification/repair radical SAM protein [Candidatus Atribacteria bacterium]